MKWLLDQLSKSSGQAQLSEPIQPKLLGEKSNFATAFRSWENSFLNSTSVAVPDASICLIYNRAGALAISTTCGGLLSIVPPYSMCLIHAGRYQILESRGAHAAYYLANVDPSPSYLRDLLTRTGHQVSTRSIQLGMQWHASEFARLHNSHSAPSYFESIAMVFGTIAHFESNPSKLDFAPVPLVESPAIQRVCEGVKGSHLAEWNNLSGSRLAGYSHHHFSRTFNQVMGCGFHEYVERVRLSIALELLLGRSATLESAPEQAGFASSGAFRDAMKSLVGFSPSELKGLAVGDARAHEAHSRRYS